jgi:cadmium resistance protein CadD (predicted permease)
MSFDFKRMLKFEHNVGDKEKKYRIYAGAALFVLSVVTASILLLVVGCALIASGFFGFCPVYAGLGKNTCEVAGSGPAGE